MKTLALILTASLTMLFATGCQTAHTAAVESTDLAAHAVHKTGHAVAHGVREVEEW
jgi:hypothetical protein